jgi:sucrose-6-phosphate hydrolase SacC (GH32 family)
MQVRRSADGTRFVPIGFTGSELDIAGVKTPFHLPPHERTLKLELFLDKSVLEVIANNHACFTRVIYPEQADLGVALAAVGGTARVRSFHAWKMRAIW